MRPPIRLPLTAARRPLPLRHITRPSSSDSSLDALFQSPKLKANPAAFARQVRKRVGEYRDRQGAGTTPGRHPLAPPPEQQRPIRVEQGPAGTSVRIFASHLVLSTSDSSDLSIGYTFLRDSCPCPACIQPSTLQKLLKAGQAYEELRPGGALQVPSVRIETCEDGSQGLAICWPSHESFYPFSLLRRLADTTHQPIEQTRQILDPVEWSSRDALIASPSLRIPYATFLSSSSSQHALVAQLVSYGLVILTGVPTTHTADAECEMRRAMGVLGELRNTFYGTTWDVKAVRNSRNIAYTDVDLGFHQDLCYFESPPRFQALHCLRNKVIGGSSYFTDSFAALRHMLTHHPEHYAALRDMDVPFVYDNDGYWYYRAHRTVEEAPRNTGIPGTSGAAGDVQFHAVNYSPPFQAPFPPSSSPEAQDKLFSALATFERLLAREEGMYEFTMAEGDMVVFDNRRVLHARRAFRDHPQEAGTTVAAVRTDGEATRWLKGCYMDGDVVWNKMRVMNRLVRTGKVEPLPAWKEALKGRGLIG